MSRVPTPKPDAEVSGGGGGGGGGQFAALDGALGRWELRFDHFEPQTEAIREVICAQANGYFGCRAAAPESGDSAFSDASDPRARIHYPGTYRAGLYDRLVTEVEGKRIPHEGVVNLPNWLALEFRCEDNPFLRLSDVEILEFSQRLDFQRGLFERRARLRDAAGRITRLCDRRLVSIADAHLGALRFELTPENWSGRIGLRCYIGLTVRNGNAADYQKLDSIHWHDLRVAERSREDGIERVIVSGETRESRVRIAIGTRSRIEVGAQPQAWGEPLPNGGACAGSAAEASLQAGQSVVVEKICALYTGRDWAISEPVEAARIALATAGSFDDLAAPHTRAWAELWERFGIEIDGQPELTGGLRLCLFHLLQTFSIHSVAIDAAAPARGWIGEGYAGHVFWDELFLLPILSLRVPKLSRGLLAYRCRRLAAARRAAAAIGCRGALFPWRSASDGREVTDPYRMNPHNGHFIPDHSRLQRHIGSAIAYNCWQYFQLTGDAEFLSDHGAELIVEVARFWASYARYNPGRQRYDIRAVVGPDEFHDGYHGALEPGIDNNAYTNVVAAWTIATAQRALTALGPRRSAELRCALELGDAELAEMAKVGRSLYVPFADDGVIEQFEGYAKLAPLDLEAYMRTHPDVRRVDDLMNAEGDDVNRYQVSKQADVLMMFYLLSPHELSELFAQLGYQLPADALRRNLDYYAPRTVHGSTLSRVVYAWVSARSDRGASFDVAEQALFTDFCRHHPSSTTAEGIHLGAMAGAVDIFQRCYLGLAAHGDTLWLEPSVPEALAGLSLRLLYRGHWLQVTIHCDKLELSGGGSRTLCDPGLRRANQLDPGERRQVSLAPRARE